MRTLPHSREAYQLLHEGSIALAEVEANGIRVDEDYLAKASSRIKRRIQHLQDNLQKSEVMTKWREAFGKRTKLGSGDQLGAVLFDEDKMKFNCPDRTATGRYKTDEESLSKVDHPFVRDYLRIKRLEKSLRTYLRGIQREVVDGIIHPTYNLHIPRTYRSSASDPNFQNIPIRDPEIARLIRRAFIARPGRRLVEVDYSGMEVCIAACYHQDPAMLEYLEDETKDMHRDAAGECFKLSPEEMLADPTLGHPDKVRVKDIRYAAKNRFVFPEFYGDWYIDCARNLWEAISSLNLHARDGRSLYDHLRQKGIRELGSLDPGSKPREGTFERHIQLVEKRWWGERFPVYARWKQKWVNQYHEQGWMQMLTGFICQGTLKRNEIINYPVQGTAFHCLLRSLIHLQREIRTRKMRTLLIGQIHDSILADVPKEEVDDYLALAHRVMVNDLLDAWSWIIVPIEIDAEMTPVEGNWYDKREVEIV